MTPACAGECADPTGLRPPAPRLPQATVQTCMAVMTGRRIRHLAVGDGHALAGVISIGDVGKAVTGA